MSKLHHSESLESLLSNKPSSSVRKQGLSKKIWAVLTCINCCLLIATLIFTGKAFRSLQGIQEVSESISSKVQTSTYSSGHQHLSSDKPLDTSNWLTCGNNSAQAIENGCIFDLMLSTWLHPECYWHEHSSTALDAANLTFFLDDQLTIPFLDAGSGDWPQHYIYTQPGYHALHCSYMWERQIMAWTAGSQIDTQSWDVDHTKHCAMTVLESNRPYPYRTARLRRGFSECGRP